VTADTWRKSRSSQNNANCVEVRNTLDQVRDSKNTGGQVLLGDVRALARAVRDGKLDQ
jgi:hypothetical protein